MNSAVFIAIGAVSRADPAIRCAPEENLERLDVAIIDGGRREIDMAAQLLTDRPVIEALTRAAERGVTVRIYLDNVQLAEHGRTQVFEDLADTAGVEIRVKQDHGAAMHLNSYEIDGRLLRTAAQIFTQSGEKRQDKDLVVIDNPDAAAVFKR